MPVLSPAAEELKTLILETGLEILDDSGLHFDFETVSYASVFRQLKEKYGITVTGSSVHGRIWPSQEHFQLDVVSELYRQDPTHTRQSFERSLALFDGIPDELAPEERTREFARRLGIHFGDRMGYWRWVQMILLNAAAARSSDPEVARKFQEMNHSQIGVERRLWAARFQELFHRLDLAPRPDIKETLPEILMRFVNISARLVCGFVLDSELAGRTEDELFTLPSPLADEGLPWHILSVAFHGNIMAMFEQARPGGRPRVPAADTGDLFASSPEPPLPVVIPDASERRSRHELRALLIQVGIDRIRRQGIVLTPSSLSYRAVFERIKQNNGFTVNRSSVHKRFWESIDSFRIDVLVEAASRLHFVNEREDIGSDSSFVFGPDGEIDVYKSVKLRLETLKGRREKFEGDHGAYCKSIILNCALIGLPGDVDHRVPALRERLVEARQRHLATMQQLAQDQFEANEVVPNPKLALDHAAAARCISSIVVILSCGQDFQKMWGADDPDVPTITRRDKFGEAEIWQLDIMSMYAVMAQLLGLPI